MGRRLRPTILGMMAVIVALALAFAALRSASDLWFSTLYTFTAVVLLVAVIAARFGRGGARAFWFGFAVFGWGFFFLGMGPWMHPYVDSDGPGGLNPDLLTSRAVLFLVPYLRTETDDLEAISKITANTIGIAHLLITLALAPAGGAIALWLRRRRGRPVSGSVGKALTLVSIPTALGLGIALERGGASTRPSVVFFPAASKGAAGEKLSDFVVKWYSKHLIAMAETPLWVLARHDRAAVVYRLLWLPSFHHPVCVRIDRTEQGGKLHVRVLDGYGGYEPGQVAIDKNVALGREQWTTLQRHLDEAAFWAIPTKIKDDGGCDGDQLIVEGMRNGAYHVVDRWQPEAAYAKLCRYMLDLSGLKVEETWTEYHSNGDEEPTPSPPSTSAPGPGTSPAHSGGV